MPNFAMVVYDGTTKEYQTKGYKFKQGVPLRVEGKAILDYLQTTGGFKILSSGEDTSIQEPSAPPRRRKPSEDSSKAPKGGIVETSTYFEEDSKPPLNNGDVTESAEALLMELEYTEGQVEEIKGTGSGGKITKLDVQKHQLKLKAQEG